MSRKIECVNSPNAPKALGNYSHAVAYGDLVFVSGMASRDPKTNEIPEGVRAQTRATLENIRNVLQAAGTSLTRVLEVNTYLLDMKDFAAYNEVYAEFFSEHRPARTTLGVASLPGKISIEIKVIAARDV